MGHRSRSSIVALAVIVAMTALTGVPSDRLHDDLALLTVQNATPARLAALGEALAAFIDAGLEPPGLEIEFFASERSCGGAPGRFISSEVPPSIRICSTDLDSIYAHELAHAWESANVTDEQREAFMRFRGNSSWADPDHDWRERGVEGAALVIQQGVAGLPLPPALGREARSRLEGYELLTGRPAPVLVQWVQTRDLPCEERPTPLSAGLSDQTGRICEPPTPSLGTGRLS